MEVTVRRHAVAVDSRGQETVKLSGMQRRLIESDYPVRIASAPTGAGKVLSFVRRSYNMEHAFSLWRPPDV